MLAPRKVSVGLAASLLLSSAASACANLSGLSGGGDGGGRDDSSIDSRADSTPEASPGLADGGVDATKAHADSSVDAAADGGVDAADAIPADSSNPDGCSPAQPNLLGAQNFTQGCTGWQSYRLNLFDSNMGRCGPKSCRVCTLEGITDGTLSILVPTTLDAGEKFEFSYFVEAASGSDASTESVTGVIDNFVGSQPDLSSWSQGTAAEDTSLSGVPSFPTILLSFNVHTNTPEDCVLLGDAVLVRTR